jgi:hypothetical protein
MRPTLSPPHHKLLLRPLHPRSNRPRTRPPPIPPREAEHQPAHLEPNEPSTDQTEQNGRDPYIQQAIDRERDRQQAFEQGNNLDRDNDLGYAV